MTRASERMAVVVGGMLGGGARIGVSLLLNPEEGFPLGTFVVNVVGAMLLGYLLTRLVRVVDDRSLAIPLLCTGVLGSFTTFSALSFEVWGLLDDGRVALSLGYAAASLALGLGGAWAGVRAAERAR